MRFFTVGFNVCLKVNEVQNATKILLTLHLFSSCFQGLDICRCVCAKLSDYIGQEVSFGNEIKWLQLKAGRYAAFLFL